MSANTARHMAESKTTMTVDGIRAFCCHCCHCRCLSATSSLIRSLFWNMRWVAVRSREQGQLQCLMVDGITVTHVQMLLLLLLQLLRLTAVQFPKSRDS